MFLQVSVCQNGGSPSRGGLCPAEGLNRRGFCLGGLCPGVSVRGDLHLGEVSVQGFLSGGSLSWGLCTGGFSVQEVSVQGGLCQRDPLYGYLRPVLILLGCILFAMYLQSELYGIPDRADENLMDSLFQLYNKQVRPKGSKGEAATVNIAFSLLAINSLVSYILPICFVTWEKKVLSPFCA